MDACEDVSVGVRTQLDADAGRHDNQAITWQTRFAELDRQFQEAMAQQHTSTTREKETQDLVHTLQARLANEETKTGAVKQHNDALTQQLKRARADLEACMEATAAASEREAAAVEAARVSNTLHALPCPWPTQCVLRTWLCMPLHKSASTQSREAQAIRTRNACQRSCSPSDARAGACHPTHRCQSMH